jgi:hypothetical protein
LVEVCPDESTLCRWLERAVADGRLLRCGNGHRGNAYRYWLKESEERWKRDPYYMDEADLQFDRLQKKLPPLLPPSIRKLVEKSEERRG